MTEGGRDDGERRRNDRGQDGDGGQRLDCPSRRAILGAAASCTRHQLQPWKADPMLTISRGRSPLATRIGFVCLALAMVVLASVLASCGGDDATPPPPTVIRADETPSTDAATATPTLTPTPTPEEGYPAPPPTQPPAE